MANDFQSAVGGVARSPHSEAPVAVVRGTHQRFQPMRRGEQLDMSHVVRSYEKRGLREQGAWRC